MNVPNNISRYLTHYYIFPKEGSPDNTLVGTEEHSERFTSHITEGLLHLRRLKGI